MIKHKRSYKLEDIFAAGTPGMQTFRALRAKLSRDYLIFFRGLEKTYQIGMFKGEAKAAFNLVLSTIRLVDRSIRSGIPEKTDVEDIIANIDSLNAQRDFFVQAAKETRPIREKLEEIEEETGVSPEALGITEEIVRRGVKAEKGERRKARREVGGLRRIMPRTMGLGAELGKGLAVAALGPMYPVAKALGAPVRDVLGLGRAAFQKVRERRERKLGERLEPMARGYPTRELERGASLRGMGLPVSRVRGTSERQAVTLPFRQFFNKEAYRAKWTKELLEELKGQSKAQRRGGPGLPGGQALAGLSTRIKDALFAAMGITSVGGALVVGTLTVGTAVITTLIAKEFVKELKDVVDTFKELGRKEKEKVKNLKKFPVISPVTGKPYSPGIQKQRKELIKELEQPLWWRVVKGLMAPPPAKIQAPSEKMRTVELERISSRATELMKKEPGLRPTFGTEETDKQLLDAINGLTNQIKSGQLGSIFKEPGLGNPNDSADSFLREVYFGGVTLGVR